MHVSMAPETESYQIYKFVGTSLRFKFPVMDFQILITTAKPAAVVVSTEDFVGYLFRHFGAAELDHNISEQVRTGKSPGKYSKFNGHICCFRKYFGVGCIDNLTVQMLVQVPQETGCLSHIMAA